MRVCLSVTTLDPALARRMEPRAPHARAAACGDRRADRAGVPAGVLAAPMIPALNDAELERILEAAARAGARCAGYVLLRLPHELKQIVEDWLHRTSPTAQRRVLELVRETRAGALNDARFGQRMRGTGVYADLLAQRFAPRGAAVGAGQPARSWTARASRRRRRRGRRGLRRRRCRCSDAHGCRARVLAASWGIAAGPPG